MWVPLIRTVGICFRIHTPRLRRTPLREGTRSGGPSVVTWWNRDIVGIMEHRKTRKKELVTIGDYTVGNRRLLQG